MLDDKLNFKLELALPQFDIYSMQSDFKTFAIRSQETGKNPISSKELALARINVDNPFNPVWYELAATKEVFLVLSEYITGDSTRVILLSDNPFFNSEFLSKNNSLPGFISDELGRDYLAKAKFGDKKCLLLDSVKPIRLDDLAKHPVGEFLFKDVVLEYAKKCKFMQDMDFEMQFEEENVFNGGTSFSFMDNLIHNSFDHPSIGNYAGAYDVAISRVVSYKKSR